MLDLSDKSALAKASQEALQESLSHCPAGFVEDATKAFGVQVEFFPMAAMAARAQPEPSAAAAAAAVAYLDVGTERASTEVAKRASRGLYQAGEETLPTQAPLK